ncbi:amino acid permease/ SLC12A domain-containing protein [Polychytrium aggregatum]|uniref:amino acid permease/ SLC12A domain-containing protein n=1 Tax=Polychytrium aggregatum TaxID=110093 RepID=UPI0022FE9D80|nr:amino acid permease/ SLC12A domain-containing protein [Polychytrium aggregatum]KAI9208073.1 amino acid permease/ SLC12A domain-containing protein [Polychytrium aggregatum]
MAETDADTDTDTIVGDADATLRRDLKSHHLQMIVIGGTVGTGLFLASGGNIASAGPLGALAAYLLVGLLVYCTTSCLGEMSTYIPISGGLSHFAGRFVDPALAFALGWNYWLSWIVTIGVEMAAAGIVISFWSPSLPTLLMPILLFVGIIGLNCLNVRYYGEIEFWLAMIKIVMCVMFIFVSILFNVGFLGSSRQYIGFRYWQSPGAFNGDAPAFFHVMIAAAFSFQGTELLGIVAGEAENPSKSIPKAIRSVPWRILLLYISVIFMIGINIPFNDAELGSQSGEDPKYSPFTLILSRAGSNLGSHLVNAVVLTAVLSACNSDLYSCSRTLRTLAIEGKAPALFSRVNGQGVPILAVLASGLIGGTAMIAVVASGSASAFVWLLNFSGVVGLLSWMSIGISSLRFRLAHAAQARKQEKLDHRAPFFPLPHCITIGGCILLVILQGYSTLATPGSHGSDLFSAYCGILPFTLAYLGYKLTKGTKLVALEEVDLDTGRPRVAPWIKSSLDSSARSNEII